MGNLEKFNISNLKNVFLAPKQSICSTFYFTKDYPDKKFQVRVVYETCGKTYIEEYVIDLDFKNIVLNAKPEIKDELSALEHINNAIVLLTEKIM